MRAVSGTLESRKRMTTRQRLEQLAQECHESGTREDLMIATVLYVLLAVLYDGNLKALADLCARFVPLQIAHNGGGN
jgi:hypothetical protein